MRRLPVLVALAASLALSTLAPLRAATVAGVDLPDTAKVGDQTLALNGAALRSKFFFKVYVGGLYLPQKQGDVGAILAADTPRRMVMRFLRTVSAEQLCEGWNEGLAANTPNPSAELTQKFEKLCGLMREVDDGTVLALTYVPGTGTQITFAGWDRGTIEGKDFADALLNCWIGVEPGPGEDFKEGILGH